MQLLKLAQLAAETCRQARQLREAFGQTVLEDYQIPDGTEIWQFLDPDSLCSSHVRFFGAYAERLTWSRERGETVSLEQLWTEALTNFVHEIRARANRLRSASSATPTPRTPQG